MENRFNRRQNTSLWWQVHLDRLIDNGETLKERGNETFQKFEDLKAYRDDIDGWLNDAAAEVRTIYSDPSIADEFCRRVEGIDLENSSWENVIKSLKATIDDRTKGLRFLINNSPAENDV